MPGVVFVSLVPVPRDMLVSCSQQRGPMQIPTVSLCFGHVSLNVVLFGGGGGGGGELNAIHQ